MSCRPLQLKNQKKTKKIKKSKKVFPEKGQSKMLKVELLLLIGTLMKLSSWNRLMRMMRKGKRKLRNN